MDVSGSYALSSGINGLCCDGPRRAHLVFWEEWPAAYREPGDTAAVSRSAASTQSSRSCKIIFFSNLLKEECDSLIQVHQMDSPSHSEHINNGDV